MFHFIWFVNSRKSVCKKIAYSFYKHMIHECTNEQTEQTMTEKNIKIPGDDKGAMCNSYI